MTTLRSADLRSVLDVVYLLNGDGESGAGLGEVLAELGRLLGADVASCTRVDHRTDALVATAVTPADQDLSAVPGFHAVFDQHPALAAYRSGRLEQGRSIALTEMAEPASLRKLPLYVDYYAARGTRDQLVCLVSLDRRHGTSLAFNRDRRGFSDRDHAIVDLVTPHLTQALDRRARLDGLRLAGRQVARQAFEVERARQRWVTLTAAERRVVEYLADGLANQQIARAVGISPRTVDKHLQNVYRKLEISNRAALIALVHRV